MAGGRPTSYKPEYCEMLIDHMAKGLSFQAFAGVVGCAIQTLYAWSEENQEFLDAKRTGEGKSLLWWEAAGNQGLFSHKDGPSLNTGVYCFNMKNRFRQYGWSDKQEIEQTLKQELTVTALGPADIRKAIELDPAFAKEEG